MRDNNRTPGKDVMEKFYSGTDFGLAFYDHEANAAISKGWQSFKVNNQSQTKHAKKDENGDLSEVRRLLVDPSLLSHEDIAEHCIEENYGDLRGYIAVFNGRCLEKTPGLLEISSTDHMVEYLGGREDPDIEGDSIYARPIPSHTNTNFKGSRSHT